MPRPTRTIPSRRRRSVVFPVAAATIALLAPIVLWTRFGDGDGVHSLQVAVAAAIVAWAIARRAEDRDSAAAAARPAPRSATHGPGCSPQRHAKAASRLSRDVGCRAAAGLERERRPARRRSRP